MHFTPEEKEALLEVKGVGPVVIKRFEEIGIYSFAALSKYHADDIADMVASMLQTSCWKNSPQSKKAINSTIELARNSVAS
tara:strand:+ start:2491 stop:2733 length:243 start_codon:yes stop_codon:yes gene_type:complete